METTLYNGVNEHIRIEIKNKNKKIIILFNKYADSLNAELTFNNLKNNNHILNEKSVILSDIEYNTYISNLCKIILSWNEKYDGELDIEFNIKINIDKIVKNINGVGDYPENWNDFILELNNIEKLYNKKINEREIKIKLIDLDKLNNLIEDLINNPDCCTIYTPEKTDQFSIYESVPGTILSNFIKYMDENNLFDEDYINNYEKIKSFNINDLSYLELITYLTMIIKRENLYPSSLYNDIHDGLLLKILNKIKDVIS